jgi:3-hydroxyacyl-CoA dehydrogenase
MNVSHYQINRGVATITLDHSPVNALALPLRRQLGDALLAALDDREVLAIVLTGKGRGFSAGGDITEFDSPAVLQEPTLFTLFSRIEASAKPVVAALHGMAVGGGLELAMACHARIAQTSTKVGLPEVHLGLVPGAGGTQRLPRLVGLERAFNMIVLGQTVPAQTLRDSGLFDGVTDGDALSAGITLARELADFVKAGGSLKRTGQLHVQMPDAEAFLAFGRAAVKTRSVGSPATLACVECLELAITLPFEEGLIREQETVTRLCATPQFAGLRHAFLAERRASQITALPADVKPRSIEHAAVIGAGTMGIGIAISLANASIPVIMIERDQSALDRGLNSLRQHYETSRQKGKLTSEQSEQRLGLIKGGLTYDGVRQADLVIEAVFEDMSAKRQVFEQLDAHAKAGAVLATNTSMLDVNEIARATRRPNDVLGLHFFSPAQVMKLLEVVRGEQTATEVLVTSLALASRMGKTAVVSGVCEGFIGNRMLQPYLTQAGLLLDEGALPAQVDRAIETWGMAMGPFRVCDLAGNDLGAQIRRQHQDKHPDRVCSRTFDAVVAMGRHGQKTGRGWYDYVPDQRAPQPSAEVTAAIVAESRRLGLERRQISDTEIVDRLLLALINEGARIFDEGIAQRASDIDVVYIAGYGFPRWRGGPMFSADRRGLPDVVAGLKRLTRGPHYQNREAFWQPADLLCQLAANGGLFSSLTQSETR